VFNAAAMMLLLHFSLEGHGKKHPDWILSTTVSTLPTLALASE
jgi:hypothetical protein